MIKLFTKKRKGFTLIELVVVIAILGILAAIAIPRLTGFSSTAQTRANEATQATVQSAWNIYQADSNTANVWPTSYLEKATGDATQVTITQGSKTYVLDNNGGVWSVTSVTP
jgi:type IV pilus assembly protein PilA